MRIQAIFAPMKNIQAGQGVIPMRRRAVGEIVNFPDNAGPALGRRVSSADGCSLAR
jgi:hypothetical protein